MKLPLSLLQTLITLPSKDTKSIRMLLDDCGLEVKNLEAVGSDTVFTIETLANRADHRSVLGVARELSARLRTPVKATELTQTIPSKECSKKVTIETPLCAQYDAVEATIGSLTLSPLVAATAKALGSSSFEGAEQLVTILNHAQLELGQPMHAFDRDKLSGGIFVRELSKSEKIIALDGKEYLVPVGAIVICDQEKIVAVAGVIGCENSKVSATTKNVLLESATFEPVSVRKAARALGLATEASGIFERGSDQSAIIKGLQRVLALSGQGLQPTGYTSVVRTQIPTRAVSVSVGYIGKQLNLSLSEKEIVEILSYLGYGISVQGEQLIVAVPPHRLHDVSMRDDIVEDVARSISLNKIAQQLPPQTASLPPVTAAEQLRAHADTVLHGQGFREVITKIFYTADLASSVSRLLGTEAHLQVANALERGYSHLRMTLGIHHARIAAEQSKRGVASLKIYEVGKVFYRSKEKLPKGFVSVDPQYQHEQEILAISQYGRVYDTEWKAHPVLSELLYHFRGTVLSVVAMHAGKRRLVTVKESAHPFYHPGAQGAVYVGETLVGYFGVLHPALSRKEELKQPLLHAELYTEALATISEAKPSPASEFPRIKRDLTLFVGLKQAAGEVVQLVQKLAVENLTDCEIVDDFKKEQEEKRRVTVRFTFQSLEKTLASEFVDQKMELLLSTLKEKDFIMAT